MRQRKWINILAIFVMMFSIVVSPISAQTVKASNIIFNLAVDQIDGTNQLSWQVEDYPNEEFVDFTLVKNGEKVLVDPTIVNQYVSQYEGDPERSVYVVDYLYVDAAVESNTDYTYKVIGITESGSEFESEEVTATTSDIQGKTEETSDTDGAEEPEGSVEPEDDKTESDASSSNIVEFNDQNLEEIIRAVSGVYDRGLTVTDLEGLTKLDLAWEDIEDLSGLEYATNLTRIDLRSNHVTDLTPLASLTNLESLVLEENSFADVSPLSNLTNLSHLQLGVNSNLVDIQPLTNLTNLKKLDLHLTGVKDITPLSALSNLDYLYLNGLDLDLTDGSNTVETIYSLESHGVTVYYDEDTDQDEDTNNESDYLRYSDIRSTSDSITIEWYFSGSFEEFNLYLNDEYIDTVSADTSAYVFENLDPNTEYHIEVSGSSNRTGYSALGDKETKMNPEDLHEVTVKVVDQDQEPVLYGYEFMINGTDDVNQEYTNSGYIEEGNFYSWEESSLNLPVGSYDVIIYDSEDVTRSQSYQIEVQDGVDYEANPFELTLDENELASHPFEVNVVDVTENSFDIEWTDMENIQGYELYVYSNDGDYNDSITLEPGTTSYSFTNLESDVLYNVDVNFVFANGLTDGKYFNVQTNGGEVLGDVVSFPDANLDQAIREELGIYFRDLTTNDLEQLTSLNADSREISDLTGLEHAVNLTDLDLYENNIEDIQPLKELTSLTYLVLWDNKIEDVSPLSNLTQLTYLDLDTNKIVDASPLINLKNLETIWLINNQITDLSTAEALLDAGVEVYYDGNDEEDQEVLIDVTDVTEGSITIDWFVSEYADMVDNFELVINGSSTTVDADTTSYTFTNLEPNTNYDIVVYANHTFDGQSSGDVEVSTDYSEDQLNDVRVKVSNLPESDFGYYEFNIAGTDESNQNIFENGYVNEADFLTNGETTSFALPAGKYEVILFDPEWMDTAGIYQMEVQEGINYIEQPIELEYDSEQEQTPIEGEVVSFNDENLERVIRDELGVGERELYTSDLEALTSLYAEGQSIQDLTGLEYAVNLEYLDLYDNKIEDISALTELTSLTDLILWDNNISDISALANLSNLTYLDLDTNKISDVSDLSGLSNLETLWLANNPAEDISSLDTLIDLNYLYLYGVPLDFENTQSMPVIEMLQTAGVSVEYDGQYNFPSLSAYVETVSDTAIDVEWWMENGNTVDHFDLYQNGEKVETVPFDVYDFTFESLESNTEYEFSIDAIDENGDIVASNTFFAQTAHAQAEMKNVKLRVMDSDNQVVDEGLEYSIQGIGENNQDIYLYGYTDEDGFLRSWYTPGQTVSLPIGEYEVIVYGDGVHQSTIEQIEIVDDRDYEQEPYEITVNELEKELKTITVKVTDQNGEPVNSLEYLSLYSSDIMNATNYQYGDYYLWELQNDQGEYTIDNVFVTDTYQYQLNVRSEGYITHNGTNVEVNSDSDSDVIELEVTLNQGATITGNIVDSQGNPVAGADYHVYGNETYVYGQTNGQEMSIGGLHSEDLTVEITMAGYQTEMIEVSKEQFVDNHFDIGTIELQSEQYVHGTVYKENGEPASNVYVNLYEEGSAWSSYWAPTDANGYFKIYNVEDGNYTLKTDAYNLPNVEISDVKPQGEEYTISLVEDGEGNFAGEGNGFTASKKTVVPGETLDYRLNYKNNGDATAEDVEVSLNLSADVDLIEESILVNGQSVESNRGKITIPSVEAGEAGTITFKTTVSDDASKTIVSTASLSLGSDNKTTYTATTNVLFVTLNAPEVTASSDIKVYGNVKPGATVEIYDGDVLLAETTTVDSKWWFADVSLPTTSDENSTHQLVAKVTEGEGASYSQPVTVAYEPNTPEVTDVNISAGWNQNITINPNTGVVTTAIVEYTPIDVAVEFSGAVDSASISFLGKEYELDKEDGNYVGSIPGTWSSYGEQMLELHFTVGDKVLKLPLMEVIVLIDPSGYVFEGSMENRLQGVHAVVEESKGENWKHWDAASYGQVNPQVTDEDGRYGWDVIKGDWRVIFSKDGYETYTSRTVTVPPAETELNVPLIRTSAPVVDAVTPTQEATEVPLNSSVTIEFDRLMNEEDIESNIQVFNGDQLVEGTFTLKGLNGYKETPDKPGYFEEDSTKKLSQTIVWTPSSELDANATYTVVISGDLEDYAGKTLESNIKTTFTTVDVTEEPVDPDNGDQPDKEDSTEDSESGDQQEQGNDEGTPDTEDQPGNENGTGNDSESDDQQEQGNDQGTNDREQQENVTENENNDKHVTNTTQPIVTVKPTVKDDKATINDDAFSSLEKEGTLQIDLIEDENNTKVEVELSQDQVELLKDKNAKVDITNGDVSLSIPPSVFTHGSKQVVIKVEKLDDVKTALSNIYDFTIWQDDKIISEFNEGITLTFDVDQNKVSKSENVKVFYWNEEANEWELIGGEYKDGKVTATTFHFSTYGVFETTNDVIASSNDVVTPEKQDDEKLPNTATNMYNWIFISLVLLLVGSALLFIQKRKISK